MIDSNKFKFFGSRDISEIRVLFLNRNKMIRGGLPLKEDVVEDTIAEAKEISYIFLSLIPLRGYRYL